MWNNLEYPGIGIRQVFCIYPVLNMVNAPIDSLNYGAMSNEAAKAEEARSEEFELMIERLLIILQDPQFKGCPVKDSKVVDEYLLKFGSSPPENWLDQLENAPEIDKMVYGKGLVLLAVRSKLSRRFFAPNFYEQIVKGTKIAKTQEKLVVNLNGATNSNPIQNEASMSIAMQNGDGKCAPTEDSTIIAVDNIVCHGEKMGHRQKQNHIETNGHMVAQINSNEAKAEPKPKPKPKVEEDVALVMQDGTQNYSNARKGMKKSVSFGKNIVHEYTEMEENQLTNGDFHETNGHESHVENGFDVDVEHLTSDVTKFCAVEESHVTSSDANNNSSKCTAIQQFSDTKLRPMENLERTFVARVVSAFDPTGFTVQVEDFTPMDAYFHDTLKLDIDKMRLAGVDKINDEQPVEQGFYAVYCNGLWHRAFVSCDARRRNGMYRAFMVDRGEYVMTKDLVPLPLSAYVMQEMLAIRCVLVGVVPQDERDKTWNPEAAQSFVHFVLGKAFTLTMHGEPSLWQENCSPPLPLIQVQLKNGNEDIGEKLVCEGFARWSQ